MSGGRAQLVAKRGAVDLFDRIGDFLRDHHLCADPVHYAFAHCVLTRPGTAMAQSVRELTDGGVRLSHADIERLWGAAAAVEPTGALAAVATEDGAQTRDGLVAQTQMQVEGFSDMVQAMRLETEGFGRDLAASAHAMRGINVLGVGDVMRLTGAMLDRVRTAETRLEAATREANELRAKLEEARDNARRDPLTDLPNRRAFEEAFAAAGETSLCVAVCDVDRFKMVNDRFGHAVGDRVLRAIAEALSLACAGHFVSRYGGEEFALLFSGVTPEIALRTLDEARLTVASKRYRVRGSNEPLGEVTFSAGFTIAAPGEALDTVFARADALLYAAKNAGRNQLKADVDGCQRLAQIPI